MERHDDPSNLLRSPASSGTGKSPVDTGPRANRHAEDQAAFCGDCAFGRVCANAELDRLGLSELNVLAVHDGPFRNGQAIFRTGQRFNSIYAVRRGAIKTCRVDELGREHVLGFALPGEMVGLSGIHSGTYRCDAIALETVSVCRFSFPALATLAEHAPKLQRELFRLLSQDIAKATLLAGDWTAEERLAALLVHLAERSGNACAVHLPMSRADIANYLRLATETVSRVLHRLRSRGLIRVAGRDITFRDPEVLHSMARAILEN